VEKYLGEELVAGCVAGPLQKSSVPQAYVCQSVWVRPENHQPNKWRLIVDLSYPDDGSVNGEIPKKTVFLAVHNSGLSN